MIPSKYQQALYDWIQKGSGSAIVQARAGSGKTTSIINALRYIPMNQRVVFLAFNKSIATELQARVPKHVEARTLNSLGHAAWMKYAGGKVNLDADKVKKIVKSLQDTLESQYRQTSAEDHYEAWTQSKDHYKSLMDLVRKAKVAGVTPAGVTGVMGLAPDTEETWLGLADHYGIEMPANTKTLIGLARRVLRTGVLDKACIDFDDQFYMSLLYGAPFPQFNWIFVDESQDVSDIQREILKRCLKTGGRLVAVGDSHQSVYGFRGSNPESMNLIQKAFKAIELPLSICYRCSTEVLKRAQEIVPDIEAAPGAPEGFVTDLGEMDASFDMGVFNQQDMVICRYTAPLVTLAYRLITNKIACKVKGRDIAQGLIALIDKMKCKDVKRLKEKLGDWYRAEVSRLQERDADANLDSVDDKYKSLMAVIAGSGSLTVEGLKQELEVMFADTAAGVLTLSTVHRAKGLEADRVFILNPDSMPSRRAKKDWEISQEKNILYVALTRAKIGLFFIAEVKKPTTKMGE